jgi:hypothetical protein
MLDHCRQLQICLDLIKCIFCVPFDNLLGHIVCWEGVLVDPVKIAVILNMPPTIVKQLCMTQRHTGYYCRFIRGCTSLTTPLEQLMKKYEAFCWTRDYDQTFDLLKKEVENCTHSNFS